MADQDVKSSDRSVSALVEERKVKSGLEYPELVRTFIKFLKRLIDLCKERRIKHLEISNCVVAPLLNVILNCKWSRLSPKHINRIIMMLGQLSVISQGEGQWPVRDLIEVLKSPWRRPLLTAILNGSNDLKVDEVFDLMSKEGLLIVNRVKSLLENKLAQLCLNYLAWVYRCYVFDQKRFREIISLANLQFLFDIYVILLNDIKDPRDVFNVFKSFSYEEALQMVIRLRVNFKRSDIAIQIVQMLILKLSINVLGDNENTFRQLVGLLCEMSASIHTSNIAELKKNLNSLCKLTLTSDHIYILARDLYKQFATNQEMVTYVIELYIRGLTTDANHLDKAKCVLKEPERVRELGSKLSRVFQEVSEIFTEYEIRREFILNAFCVNPCTETLNLLEKVALERGVPKFLSSLPNDCSWHESKKSGSEFCGACGGLFQPDVPIIQEQDPTKLLDPQKTSLAPHLCDDLNVVLSSTRIQQLHWNLDWTEMLKRCRGYIEQYKDLKLMLSKELEYLNIDYSQFQRLPEDLNDDPYAGVEKGYEHFIEFSDDEEEVISDSSRSRSRGSRSRKSDGEELSKPKQNTKSTVLLPEESTNNNNNKLKKLKKPANPLKAVKQIDFIDLTGSDSNEEGFIKSMHRFGKPPLAYSPFILPLNRSSNSNPNTVKSLRAFRPTLKKQISTDLKPMDLQTSNVNPTLIPNIIKPNNSNIPQLTNNLPVSNQINRFISSNVNNIHTTLTNQNQNQKLNSVNTNLLINNLSNYLTDKVPQLASSKQGIQSMQQQLTPLRPPLQQQTVQSLQTLQSSSQSSVVQTASLLPTQQTNMQMSPQKFSPQDLEKYRLNLHLQSIQSVQSVSDKTETNENKLLQTDQLKSPTKVCDLLSFNQLPKSSAPTAVVTTLSTPTYSSMKNVHTNTNTSFEQKNTIVQSNTQTDNKLQNYYWDLYLKSNDSASSQTKDSLKRKCNRKHFLELQNMKSADTPTSMTVAQMFDLAKSIASQSQQSNILKSIPSSPKDQLSKHQPSYSVSKSTASTSSLSTPITITQLSSISKHAQSKITSEQYRSIEDTLQKMFESDHSKSSSPLLSSIPPTTFTHVASETLSVANVIEKVLNTPIASTKTTNLLESNNDSKVKSAPFNSDFTNLFRNKGLSSDVSSMPTATNSTIQPQVSTAVSYPADSTTSNFSNRTVKTKSNIPKRKSVIPLKTYKNTNKQRKQNLNKESKPPVKIKPINRKLKLLLKSHLVKTTEEEHKMVVMTHPKIKSSKKSDNATISCLSPTNSQPSNDDHLKNDLNSTNEIMNKSKVLYSALTCESSTKKQKIEKSNILYSTRPTEQVPPLNNTKLFKTNNNQTIEKPKSSKRSKILYSTPAVSLSAMEKSAFEIELNKTIEEVVANISGNKNPVVAQLVDCPIETNHLKNSKTTSLNNSSQSVVLTSTEAISKLPNTLELPLDSEYFCKKFQNNLNNDTSKNCQNTKTDTQPTNTSRNSTELNEKFNLITYLNDSQTYPGTNHTTNTRNIETSTISANVQINSNIVKPFVETSLNVPNSDLKIKENSKNDNDKKNDMPVFDKVVESKIKSKDPEKLQNTDKKIQIQHQSTQTDNEILSQSCDQFKKTANNFNLNISDTTENDKSIQTDDSKDKIELNEHTAHVARETEHHLQSNLLTTFEPNILHTMDKNKIEDCMSATTNKEHQIETNMESSMLLTDIDKIFEMDNAGDLPDMEIDPEVHKHDQHVSDEKEINVFDFSVMFERSNEEFESTISSSLALDSEFVLDPTEQFHPLNIDKNNSDQIFTTTELLQEHESQIETDVPIKIPSSKIENDLSVTDEQLKIKSDAPVTTEQHKIENSTCVTAEKLTSDTPVTTEKYKVMMPEKLVASELPVTVEEREIETDVSFITIDERPTDTDAFVNIDEHKKENNFKPLLIEEEKINGDSIIVKTEQHKIENSMCVTAEKLKSDTPVTTEKYNVMMPEKRVVSELPVTVEEREIETDMSFMTIDERPSDTDALVKTDEHKIENDFKPLLIEEQKINGDNIIEKTEQHKIENSTCVTAEKRKSDTPVTTKNYKVMITGRIVPTSLPVTIEKCEIESHVSFRTINERPTDTDAFVKIDEHKIENNFKPLLIEEQKINGDNIIETTEQHETENDTLSTIDEHDIVTDVIIEKNKILNDTIAAIEDHKYESSRSITIDEHKIEKNKTLNDTMVAIEDHKYQNGTSVAIKEHDSEDYLEMTEEELKTVRNLLMIGDKSKIVNIPKSETVNKNEVAVPMTDNNDKNDDDNNKNENEKENNNENDIENDSMEIASSSVNNENVSSISVIGDLVNMFENLRRDKASNNEMESDINKNVTKVQMTDNKNENLIEVDESEKKVELERNLEEVLEETDQLVKKMNRLFDVSLLATSTDKIMENKHIQYLEDISINPIINTQTDLINIEEIKETVKISEIKERENNSEINERDNISEIKERENSAEIKERNNTSEINERGDNGSEIKERNNISEIKERDNISEIKERDNISELKERENSAEIKERDNIIETKDTDSSVKIKETDDIIEIKDTDSSAEIIETDNRVEIKETKNSVDIKEINNSIEVNTRKIKKSLESENDVKRIKIDESVVLDATIKTVQKGRSIRQKSSKKPKIECQNVKLSSNGSDLEEMDIKVNKRGIVNTYKKKSKTTKPKNSQSTARDTKISDKKLQSVIELDNDEINTMSSNDQNVAAETNVRPRSRIKILDIENVTSNDSDFFKDDSNSQSSESKTYHFTFQRTVSGRIQITPMDPSLEDQSNPPESSPFSPSNENFDVLSPSAVDDNCIFGDDKTATKNNRRKRTPIKDNYTKLIKVEKRENVIEMTISTDEESSEYDEGSVLKKRLIESDEQLGARESESTVDKSSNPPHDQDKNIRKDGQIILGGQSKMGLGVIKLNPSGTSSDLKNVVGRPLFIKKDGLMIMKIDNDTILPLKKNNVPNINNDSNTVTIDNKKFILLSSDVPCLIPISKPNIINQGLLRLGTETSLKSKASGIGKHEIEDVKGRSLPGCSNSTDNDEPRRRLLQETTGVIINNSTPTTNVSVLSTSTNLPTATTAPSTIVVQNNTLNNIINPSNGTTVVVRSTASLVQNTTSTTNTGTAAPTLVNMLIQQRSPNTRTPVAAVREVTTRLRAQNFNTVADEMFQNTSICNTTATTNTNAVSTATSNSLTAIKTVATSGHSTPNIVRATVQQTPQIVRSVAATATVVSSGGTPQLLSFQQVINSPQLLKTISTSDGVKPLQLLYKMSDGKTFHITPVPLQSSVKMAAVKQNQSGEIVKVEVLAPTKTSTNNNIGVTSTKSVFEETYAKFIHIGRNINSIVTQSNEVTSTTSSSSSLPKFQQAFGKTTSFATANNSCATTSDQQQQVLVVSKMTTSTTASTTATTSATGITSAPLTVVSVPMGATIMTTTVTSTIQRALASTGANVRLLKSNSQMPQAQSSSQLQPQSQTQSDKIDCDIDNSASNDSLSSGSITIQQGQQSTVLTPMRLALPIVQRATNASGNLLPTTRVMTPVLLRQRVLLTQGTVGGTIRLPQTARVLASNVTNTLEPSVSSSTLEQLREFDKVFEKVKERSTVQPSPNSTACATTTTVTVRDASPAVTSFINKLDNSSASVSVQVSEEDNINRSSTPVATFQTAHVDTNSIVVNQNQRQQRVGVAYVTSGSLGQAIISSPVVVMQQQPTSVASPALSVTSQSSSSPSQTVNNNPTSSSKTSQSQQINKTTLNTTATKSIKNKPIKPNTASPLKASPVPKPQQKPQEDEGTAQRIYSILAEYAEQLRNSPDLNNKPAPRRRSNPPANPTQNSKRKKSSSGKKVGSLNPAAIELSPGADDHRTMGSEDSSCGILQMSTLQDSPSQAILMDDAQSTEGSMDIPSVRGMHGDSNDCTERPSSSQSVSVPTSTPRQQLILTDTSTGNTTPRNVIITDSVVSEALAQVGKITNAATVLVPGNYLLPMSMVKGGHQITIVSGGSKILAVKPLKLPATLANNSTNSQQLTATQVLIPTVSTQNTNLPKISTQIINRTATNDQTCSKNQTIGDGNVEGITFNSTPVLAVQTNKSSNLSETNRATHQIQISSTSQVDDPSTLTGSSNGPLLSQLCELPETTHSTIILNDSVNNSIINGKLERDNIDNSKVNFKKNWITNNLSQDNIENQSDTSPVFRHSPGMQFSAEVNVQTDKKRFSTVQSSTSKFNNIQAQRKQAALERELRLQKSLSEECEDLGVDEPSASDLFPEAEILFDNTNQSPPFGNVLQDASCSNNDNDNDDNVFSTNDEQNGKANGNSETIDRDKACNKISISDHMDYLLIHKSKHNIKNGTKFTTQNSNSSQSSYEDNNTLITNTPLISDVTIPSPLPQSTSYCLPSPYRAESPLTQATHSHLYSYTKKTKSKSNKKGRSYSLFESDCELSSSSDVETTSRTSISTSDAKDNDLINADSLSDSASDHQSDNTRKYSRKRPYKLYVYDENGVDASSFTCNKDGMTNDEHISSDNNDESVSMSVDLEDVELETSDESSRSADSDVASISGVRRLSQRGHVRKGCPCCTGSSPPTKRKFTKKSLHTNKKNSGKKIS